MRHQSLLCTEQGISSRMGKRVRKQTTSFLLSGGKRDKFPIANNYRSVYLCGNTIPTLGTSVGFGTSGIAPFWLYDVF